MSKKFKYHESLHRYNSSKPSLTIDTGHRTHFHYKYNRIPTVRENARLQSFPDDFIFFGNKQEQYKQVGNAVPPLLGYAIAKKVKEYLDSIQKINIIDLFAGCGGLLDGFLQTGKFNSIASVEWEKGPVDTLRHRLRKKWKYEDVDKSVIRFDMQRIDELCGGFDTVDYGKSEGLNNIIKDRKIDVIIGGPPCQAYSVAGRVSDKNGMNNDYRNYLFEYYLELVDTYQPKAFIFENVPECCQLCQTEH
ncbi:MAG: DNA cytosine methyltransferase [Coprobacillus cateniformis]